MQGAVTRDQEAYSPEQIAEFIGNIPTLRQADSISTEKVLNTRYEEFSNELIVHHILNAYANSRDEYEKRKLRQQLKNILAMGANPNEWDQIDRSPALHRAIRLHSPRLVSILLESGKIDISAKQHDMYLTALQVCLEHWPKNINLMTKLAERAGKEIQAIFLEAIAEKKYKRIKYLIRKGLVDFNAPDTEGRYPLLLLCLMGDSKLFQFVIEKVQQSGKTIVTNVFDKNGNTALHFACHPLGQPNSDIIQWLLDNGVRPNSTNRVGDTALHHLVEHNEPIMLKRLIAGGADAGVYDALGRTPLEKYLMRPELSANSNMIQVLQSAAGDTANVAVATYIDPMLLNYERGFWIRAIGADCTDVVTAIEREMLILDKRESISAARLVKHRPDVNVNRKSHYRYSPATFVKAGLPIGLFGADCPFSLIIQTSNKIPAWCSGLRGEVKTNDDGHGDVDFSASTLSFRYAADHQISGANSDEIAIMLSRLFRDSLANYTPLELYDACLSGTYLPFNEGLLRYKRGDIKGLVVKPEPRSVSYALMFLKLCKLALEKVPFYEYDSRQGMKRISEQRVQELAAQHATTTDEDGDEVYAALQDLHFLAGSPARPTQGELAQRLDAAASGGRRRKVNGK